MSPNVFSGVGAALAVLGLTLASRESAAPTPIELRGVHSVATPTLEQPVLELQLNIPAYRLDVLESGVRTHSYSVAVGTPRYPTPVQEFEISRIVWNPWWYPPPSEWARDEKPAPPGPANPMGRVKLQASQYIYIHGTPAVSSLGSAASHGCIRMTSSDAIELARLVHSYASPRVTQLELDALEANPARTRTIDLETPVTFIAAYRIAEVRDGVLHLYRDIYGRSADPLEEVSRAIENAGVSLADVDEQALRDAWARSRRESLAIPLAELVRY